MTSGQVHPCLGPTLSTEQSRCTLTGQRVTVGPDLSSHSDLIAQNRGQLA